MDATPPDADALPPGSPATPPARAIALEGIEWRLTHHRTPEGDLVQVPAGVIASATFDAGVVAGSTGCNRYHGSYELDGPAISLGPVASTLMACEPARDAVERAFTSALAGAVAHAVAGETLELLDAEGLVVLRFRAAPPPSLVGSRWIATGINNGRGGVVSALEGVEVTAVFEDDGSVSGSGRLQPVPRPVHGGRRCPRIRPAGDNPHGLPGARGRRRAGGGLLRGARTGRDLVAARGPARASLRGRRPAGGAAAGADGVVGYRPDPVRVARPREGSLRHGPDCRSSRHRGPHGSGVRR